MMLKLQNEIIYALAIITLLQICIMFNFTFKYELYNSLI